jgi:hypothetical protein
LACNDSVTARRNEQTKLYSCKVLNVRQKYPLNIRQKHPLNIRQKTLNIRQKTSAGNYFGNYVGGGDGGGGDGGGSGLVGVVKMKVIVVVREMVMMLLVVVVQWQRAMPKSNYKNCSQ